MVSVAVKVAARQVKLAIIAQITFVPEKIVAASLAVPRIY
jgi:hypothetical protein